MRINQPVSNQAYVLHPEQTLVSVTDTKGRITYCNESFIEASGFAKHELLGQPHNLVRHPDMPEEAFRDMWDTIQAGLPWSGLVKNRRKNGDYYWVQANATPMMDGNQITGFLSVRTAPTNAAIQAADALYARMRAEAQSASKALVLRRGALVRRDLLGRVGRLFRFDVLGQVVAAQILIALSTVLVDMFQLPVWETMLVSLLSGAFVVWRVWAVAVAPLEALVADANRLASGDLSQPVHTGSAGRVGQLQQALMQMSVNLKTVVKDVRSELQRLTESVAEIAAGNQDLSERTESQASSLEETAASMEEMTGNVRQSAANASEGTALAALSSSVTEKSNAAVQHVAVSMKEIADSSKQIEDIIQLIEGVAFQTNILALNAAVEAARAGDAGRGFAVVAAEVRALAQRTATAAKDIKSLIVQSSERVHAGNTHTEQALHQMAEVLGSVQKVGTVLNEISVATREQGSGITQINEAVAHMDSMTQQNAAMVEELAAAAKSLTDQVQEAGNSMRLFRLTTGELTMSQLQAVDMRRSAKELMLA